MSIYFAVAYKLVSSTCEVCLDRIPCVNSYVADDVLCRLVRRYSSCPDFKFRVERVDVLESASDFDS